MTETTATCSCGNGQPLVAPVTYDSGFAGMVTYDPQSCADCADLSVASDLYKDREGFRPSFMSREDLLAWYRALPRG